MDETNPIKYSDLLQPDTSFETLLGLLDELGEKYSKLKQQIVSDANAIKNSIQSVNGATASGQTAISNAAKETDKLAKKEKEVIQMYTSAGQAILKHTNFLNKASRVAKLEAKVAAEREGSYNQLSARYSLVKEKLNAMTAAERENTEAGRALTQESAQIYKQMKLLQEVTGKHTLSVGDYGVATINMAADIRRAVQALAQMRLEGKAGTDQYQHLVQDLKQLKKQYAIVKTETQSLGSQTAALNQVMGALTSTSGAMTAITGLLNDETSDWAQSLVTVNKAIAVTNGLMAFVNGLYKQAFISNMLMTASKKAEVRARALNIAVLKGETKQTILLTAAQAALNIVAKANPIALLGTAIVAVAAGLALFTTNTKKATRELNNYNTGLKSTLDYYKQISEIRDKVFDLETKDDEARIRALKDTQAGLVAVWEAESKLADKRQQHNEQNKTLYKNELRNLDVNKQVLATYAKELQELKRLQASGAKDKSKVTIGYYNEMDAAALPQVPVEEIFKLDKNKMKVKLSEAIDIIQGFLDTYQAKVDVALDLTTADRELSAEQQKLVTEWRMIQRQLTDTELAERHKADVETAKLTTERFSQQALLAKLEYEEEIRLLKQKLERDMDLTIEAKKAINDQILALEGQLQIELGNIYYDRIKANKTAQRATEDLELKAIKDGFDKRRTEIKKNYAREREDIEIELRHNSELTAIEREELRKQLVASQIAEAKELSDLAHEESLDLISIARETQDAILDARTDSYAKQFEQLKIQHEREMEDMRDRLAFEGLTERQREALQEQMLAKEAAFNKARSELAKQYDLAIIENDKSLWENRLSVLNKYTYDYLLASLEIIKSDRATAIANFNAQADTLNLSLTERNEGLLAINRKYDDLELQEKQEHMLRVFDLDQELAESEFNILERSEYQKNKFARKQEIARLKEILKLNKEYGNKLTEEETKIIENRIKALENQDIQPDDIWDWLGVTPDWKDRIKDWVDTILDAYKEVLDARMELAEAQISAAQEELDMTKSALNAELQARANGYASNVALARQEFEEAKKREREALAFKRQVEKEQEMIDTITQASSLLTATSQFWATSAKLGPIAGPIAAALATSTMWAAFIAAKVKANQLRNQAATYGEGTVELLRGGSHSSGHDIALGTTPDGRERRAEGGEYFAIVNKRNSQKYGRTIEDVINAFNSGTFEKEFTRNNTLGDNPAFIHSMYSMLQSFSSEYGRTATTDLSRLETDVSALRTEMSKREYIGPDGTRVIINGNNIRRIRRNG